MRERAAKWTSLILWAGLLVFGGIGGLSAGETWSPELEAFLAKAKVVSREDIGTGITKPEKVTLELRGETHQAVFKTVDQESDSWRYEVAAYRMDRLLDIGMVPPTVARSLKGRKGCLQLWVEGATLADYEGIPPDMDLWHQQISVMWLFDDLIANIDRHLNNAVVSPHSRLQLIDNSKTFRYHDSLLNNLNGNPSGTSAQYWLVDFETTPAPYPTSYPPELLERLRSVSEKELIQAMGSLIPGPQRRRLLLRRELILDRLRELGVN